MEYLKSLESALRGGNATEHTYRSFLKQLLEERANGEAVATNEPKREKCGAPDYVISRKKDRLTLGHVEAKDIGVSLDEVEKSDQIRRYLQHLPNLLLTDYLEFRWFVRGERGVEARGRASLGRVGPGGKIVSAPEEQARALNLIDSFLRQKPIPIVSAQDLASRLAHLTHLIRDIIVGAFAGSEASPQLRSWREAFAKTLLPELSGHTETDAEAQARSEFADMFAQTLAYGLFSARASSPSGGFSRDLAQKLIPRTNPFLRDFFYQITGPDLDDEPFAGFVDDLIQTLAHADIDHILADFGKQGRRSDPVVHFYETFLQAYDPKLRELRGVYYTPEPVVNYIVESIDALLKEKFGLKEGLADRSKITTTRKEGEKEIREESHRVLILDPATGTATFLYRVLDFIREQFDKKKNLGAWGDYVHEHLLPRLFGFELLMAPYAVAHFKIGLALAAWDKEPLFRQSLSYHPQSGERINIFLTNTLEDLDAKIIDIPGMGGALSNEAREASEVKKHKPVLVILGNPPYSGHSANKGKWIVDLVRDYYQCDGKPLGERNPKWLQDDYVKFIRWAQWRIEQTGQGILGFITNHGYLDNPTFRGMRQHLMGTFDDIYLLDLHGNSKKKEIDPATGAQDKNVFDIQQGVAIGIFVKFPPDAKRKKTECVVRHAHLYSAQRAAKYQWLDGHEIKNTDWTALHPESPNYLFIPQDKTLLKEYEKGWKITEAMPVGSLGVLTKRDSLVVSFVRSELKKRIEIFANLEVSDEQTASRFKLQLFDKDNWNLQSARVGISDRLPKINIREFAYRPFDQRFIAYESELVARMNLRVLDHVNRENPALIIGRQGAAVGMGQWEVLFATFALPDQNLFSRGGATVFPLYLYPNGKLPNDDLFVKEEPEEEKRRPNFSSAFIEDLYGRLSVQFVPDGLGNPSKKQVGPEMVFHYAYAVFHSPGYRERYAEFLRTDFPRLPLTRDWELFRQLAGFGGHLVDLHARKNGHYYSDRASFPVKGDNTVKEVRYQPAQTNGPDRHGGRVWINDVQYFEGVPEDAWRFPIGGYLPAERWLKDRIGRALSYDDLAEYPRIVTALVETRRLMGEIDAAIAQHGGWPGAFC